MTTPAITALSVEHETGLRRRVLIETIEQLHGDNSLDNIETQLIDLINHVANNNHYNPEFIDY